jgi:hypothetical protein
MVTIPADHSKAGGAGQEPGVRPTPRRKAPQTPQHWLAAAYDRHGGEDLALALRLTSDRATAEAAVVGAFVSLYADSGGAGVVDSEARTRLLMHTYVRLCRPDGNDAGRHVTG